MSGRCVPPRTNHLKPGHTSPATLEPGRRYNHRRTESGRSRSRQGYPDLLPCPGICDCEFGTAPNQFCTVAGLSTWKKLV